MYLQRLIAMMKRKCKHCGVFYDLQESHECTQSLAARRKREKENRDRSTEAQKAITSRKWRNFRKQVIIADGGYCQRCFIVDGIYNYSRLEVHHIKPRSLYPELAFDEDNVVTLCKACNLNMGLDGIDFEWSPENRKIDYAEFHLG